MGLIQAREGLPISPLMPEQLGLLTGHFSTKQHIIPFLGDAKLGLVGFQTHPHREVPDPTAHLQCLDITRFRIPPVMQLGMDHSEGVQDFHQMFI